MSSWGSVLLLVSVLFTTALATGQEPMQVHAQDSVMEFIQDNVCAPVQPCVRYDRHCYAVQSPVSTLTDRYFIHSAVPSNDVFGFASPSSGDQQGQPRERVNHSNDVAPAWLNHTEAQQLMDVVWANTTGYGGRGMSREYTYGEVLVEGIQKVFEVLPLDPTSVVLDLGSGVGKFTVYTALTWNVSLSWGIEIVEHRYAKSVECAERIQAMQESVWHSPIRFSVMDFAALPHFGSTTHIYMCSTCFGTELVNRILDVAAATPSVKYIISARALGATTLNGGFSHLVNVRVPCSWSASTTFVIYCRGCNSADADASPFLSYSSRLRTNSAHDAAVSRSNRWNHLASLAESQRQSAAAQSGSPARHSAKSENEHDGSEPSWDNHQRSSRVAAPSQLEQIVSQPWWTCNFLRRRALSHLVRQIYGCATRAAEFAAATKDELLASFPDLVEYHSYQYVFVWRPQVSCRLSPVSKATDRDTAVEGSLDHHRHHSSIGDDDDDDNDNDGRGSTGVEGNTGEGAEVRTAQKPVPVPEGGGSTVDTAIIDDRLLGGAMAILVNEQSPLVFRALSKAEACFFLGESCDTEWSGYVGLAYVFTTNRVRDRLFCC